MKLALEEAKISSKNGEVPVGAISVLNGKVLVKSGNEMENNKLPTKKSMIKEFSNIIDNQIF